MIEPSSQLIFSNGITMPNRFMLAPLTNTLSHNDGSLSVEEYSWLTMRAKGGFGMTMTCACHVQDIGAGFLGQLGIFNDKLMPGHQKLTAKIKEFNSLAVIQLHHAGMRTPNEIINGMKSVSASDNSEFDARGLTLAEVKTLRDDFINAAFRAKNCGYDGAEIHAAHGYIIAQFLSSTYNQRTDEYGGSLENRTRLLMEIIKGIRIVCGKDFLLGVRLSPEKYGIDVGETKTLAQQLANENLVDFLDISLWDSFKKPMDKKYQDKTLLEHFTAIDYKDVKLTVAGNIRNGRDVQKVLAAGVDFVGIGKSAILHHDFPKRVIENPDFETVDTPVSKEYLATEGVPPKFYNYLKRWPDLVQVE